MILWFVLHFISISSATGIHSEQVACPLGKDTAKVFFVLSSNEYGGYDSDGATYSSGMQFRNYEISTCSQNLYSALGTDMKNTLTDVEEEEILKIIARTSAQFKKPKLPETWERYEIAIEIYRWQGRSSRFLISLYQKATWSIRDEAVGIHEGLAGPMLADQVLETGVQELAKNLNTEQRKLVLFNLARVAHRNARFSKREEYIEKFLTLDTLSQQERQAGERFRELTQTIEPQYLEKTRAEIERHLQEHPNDGQMLYLLGDIHRRLGNPEQCKQYFHAANLTSDLQPEQRQIMQYLLSE